MNESVREMAVADLLEDLRRMSPLERDFLQRWRAALDTTSNTAQLARVFHRVKILAAVEAKAQRHRDLAVVAAFEQFEFGCSTPEVHGTGDVDPLGAHEECTLDRDFGL